MVADLARRVSGLLPGTVAALCLMYAHLARRDGERWWPAVLIALVIVVASPAVEMALR